MGQPVHTPLPEPARTTKSHELLTSGRAWSITLALDKTCPRAEFHGSQRQGVEANHEKSEAVPRCKGMHSSGRTSGKCNRRRRIPAKSNFAATEKSSHRTAYSRLSSTIDACRYATNARSNTVRILDTSRATVRPGGTQIMPNVQTRSRRSISNARKPAAARVSRKASASFQFHGHPST